MGWSWNAIKEKVRQGGDPSQLLAVEILDGWMDDYVRDEDWLMGPDERSNMSADIRTYRQQLGQIAFGHDEAWV